MQSEAARVVTGVTRSVHTCLCKSLKKVLSKTFQKYVWKEENYPDYGPHTQLMSHGAERWLRAFDSEFGEMV